MFVPQTLGYLGSETWIFENIESAVNSVGHHSNTPRYVEVHAVVSDLPPWEEDRSSYILNSREQYIKYTRVFGAGHIRGTIATKPYECVV